MGNPYVIYYILTKGMGEINQTGALFLDKFWAIVNKKLLLIY